MSAKWTEDYACEKMWHGERRKKCRNEWENALYVRKSSKVDRISVEMESTTTAKCCWINSVTIVNEWSFLVFRISLKKPRISDYWILSWRSELPTRPAVKRRKPKAQRTLRIHSISASLEREKDKANVEIFFGISRALDKLENVFISFLCVNNNNSNDKSKLPFSVMSTK